MQAKRPRSLPQIAVVRKRHTCQRMGKSHATQTFLTIRVALRREMLLALMRMWDEHRAHINIPSIRRMLDDRRVIPALVAQRCERKKFDKGPSAGKELPSYFKMEITRTCESLAVEAKSIIDKYSIGKHTLVLEGLRRLRHERLAHHQLSRATASVEPSRDDIEAFYQDMAELIRVLMSMTFGISYSPLDTGEIHRHYAQRFWAASRGEKTEGHPDYREMAHSQRD